MTPAFGWYVRFRAPPGKTHERDYVLESKMGTPRAEVIQEVLSHCRGSFLAVGLFSFVINLLMLMAPIYVLQIFDRVLNSGSQETLLYLTLIAALAFLTLGILEAVRSLVLTKLGSWIDRRLSGLVLRNSISSALHDRGEQSVQGLRDLSTCAAFFSGPGILPILDAPWSPIFIVVIFFLHPTLGWLSIFSMLLLLALLMASEFSTRALLNRSSAKSIELLSAAEISVRNSDAVEAMGMMGNLLKRWDQSNGEALELRERASDRAGKIKAFTRSIRMFLQVGMLGMGAWLVLGNELTPGAMIAGSILFGRAMAPVDQAIGSWRSAIAARHAYRRLTDQLAGFSLRKEIFKLPKPDGRLCSEGVTFAYPGQNEPCLRFVNFALEPGESLGLVGPTAAGKTTLARLLVGNVRPRIGRVSLDGANVATWDSEDLGRHVGYLPQNVELFNGTIRANIARMGDEESSAIVDAARLAEVHEVILSMEDGYETEIGGHGAILSGGQNQRIALARALFGDPRLVVLDEPNANLDQDGDDALARTLQRLSQRKVTTVVITHRLWILRHVDKILLLRNGSVEMFGPRDEILSKIARPAAAPMRQTALESSHG